MEIYSKDHDKWNDYVKTLENRVFGDNLYEQEIWWCAIGFNIGREQDGKNDSFERPVLIIKIINLDLVLVAQITSKIVENKYRIPTTSINKTSDVVLSQIRIISTKRLIRRIGRMSNVTFQKVIIRLACLILESGNSETPPFGGESRRP